MRRILHILLLLCLPLYAFAMQGETTPAGMPAPGAQVLVHVLEHQAGIAHHHHEEDGSTHYDDSKESLDHVQEHSSCQQPANVSLPRLGSPPETLLSRVLAYRARTVLEPFLDGPHRPPAFVPGLERRGDAAHNT